MGTTKKRKDSKQKDDSNNNSESSIIEEVRKALSKPIPSESFYECLKPVVFNGDYLLSMGLDQSEYEKILDFSNVNRLMTSESYLDTFKEIESSTDNYLKYYVDTFKSLENIKTSASAVNNLLKSDQDTISEAEIQSKVEDFTQALVDNQETRKKLAIASRICSLGVEHLINHPEMFESFNEKSWNMTVVSIDIRSSTQLMLNAKTPKDYVAFISDLSFALSTQVKEDYGIYDKFTGDGLLCFFPSFYSGEDHIYRALMCAESCHNIFKTIYAKHYDKFSVVRADVGLGIGIDVGETYLTFVNNEPTVIGTPVVYACRLSSAPSNMTYLNQQVYEVIKQKYPENFELKTCETEFKGQGKMRVHECIFSKELDPVPLPEWAIGEMKETSESK